MPQYVVSIQHPYTPSPEEETLHRNVAAVSEAMRAAGVSIFAGGTQNQPASAKSPRPQLDRPMFFFDAPHPEMGQPAASFWVLEVADLDEALSWGRKAALTCRASVEVRRC
ncbi:MAG TPA: hypothetical protein VKX25_13600 [Bryobacteraceae bacterium]|jgi:hypothetical protein|nr:hypothetical protein [Bryobacteraceae bacterium]